QARSSAVEMFRGPDHMAMRRTSLPEEMPHAVGGSFASVHDARKCLQDGIYLLIIQLAGFEAEIGNDLLLDGEQHRHIGLAIQPVTRRPGDFFEDTERHTPDGELLAPLDYFRIEHRLIIAQECNPRAEIGFLVLPPGFIDFGHELAERIAERTGEDDHGRPVFGLADVAVQLTALRAGGEDERVRAGPLARL